MKEHFVFKLGPVDKEDGAFFMYYVFPGLEEDWAFPAPSDAYAIELILEVYNKESLVFEPALEDIAIEIGARVENHSPNTAHELALMAYEHLPGEPLRNVRHASLIYHFAQAVLKFCQSEPWGKPWANKPLFIELDGDAALSTWCFVHPLPEGQETIFSILFEAVEDAGELATDFACIAQRSRMSVLAMHEPEFAVDAMERAHGLSFLPLPYVLDNGVEILVNDLQIAILTVALTAIVALGDENNYATSEIELENLKISAAVSIE